MSNIDSAILLIESGLPLQMVLAHIQERRRVSAAVNEMAKELGVKTVMTHRGTGVLTAACFEGPIHPDFRVPKHGASYPKKGSAWAQRLAAQTGYRDPSEWISEAFSIPTSIAYTYADGQGWNGVGMPLAECGFLWIDIDRGPYAMWAPDVEAEVRQKLERNADCKVNEPAASFRLDIPGCRRITRTERDFLVARAKLEDEQAAARAAA